MQHAKRSLSSSSSFNTIEMRYRHWHRHCHGLDADMGTASLIGLSEARETKFVPKIFLLQIRSRPEPPWVSVLEMTARIAKREAVGP